MDYKKDPYDLGPNSLKWLPTLCFYITELSSAYRQNKPKDKELRRFCAEIYYTVQEFNKAAEKDGGSLLEIPDNPSKSLEELAAELREYLVRFHATDVWSPDDAHKQNCCLHRWVNFHGKGDYPVCDHLAYVGYILANVTYGTSSHYPEPGVWLSWFESKRSRH